MILKKTNVHVSFFWDSTPFRALSKGIEANYDAESKKLSFYFQFPSYKTNLNFNQDAESILKHLGKFDTLRFFDDYAIKNFQKISIPSELDKKEVVLRLPNDSIQILKISKIEYDNSKMIFKIDMIK